MTTIIVFGPTGHVGSAVALSAHSFGASKVVLAMRDTSKAIPGLTPDIESSRPYQRVQADLSDPASITSAVSSTGATRAFIYINHATQDHMLSAIQALQAGGITFVVFLSTGSLRGDLHAVDQKDIISWSHAQVELNLQAEFGKENYVPIRPAFFATNSFWWKRMIPTGKVKVFAPDMKVDWITPGDIGRVSASVLLGGAKPGDEEAVWLIGPQKMSLRDGITAIAKAAGKQVVIEEVGPEGGVEVYTENGTPRPVAELLVESFGKLKAVQEAGGDWLPDGEEWEAAVKVVERYTGKPAMTLEEWAEEYKDEFRG
ncbi:hypothetical protein B0T16DRAFT_459114 [Cercophora newfieldiana]|uniref:NmrA-like domain-containing protein n=1 Tax=Cercophora newfieldiana TaxID=92897 RepID=A0AA39Y0I5_9PEZI|nr:hypothetical protein B0T16DRAFT_459114 [Cercophora newfieldiana]